MSAQADLQALALASGCAEALLLSTCSRIELHAVVAEPTDDLAKESAHDVAELLGNALVGHAGPERSECEDRALTMASLTGRLAVGQPGAGAGPRSSTP
ncbi:MAG TPA: hypothetical protein VNP20_12245 [Nocardioidaceae bacterium]|nr:hypothetical protein [Nocardioidaceae bacterium]